ncbi:MULTISPECIES: PTS system mannose/fructose/sorbose family transporter subunit IID [Raoultella]|jgi:mannose/fructose/N-acetylgalactosamine-specific phosphotransferase system component IID|uniref:PTS system mannose-specific EIID component n=1 Tax=Raoultella planticola TaxID=575 RepID=A0A443VUP7_RAOPL|nr:MULTISPECIES: PTS system mannose/fructose/sorbose family transporter subunit IID [Raoultella]MDU4423144.1 PTS system mannose/fructose/sorbose family transporter subunit IID [Raoultella sp.]ATM07246.1 PTS fructose transporter subunit IID [Raoultella planticola]ATM15543.1 PTS fructose transporter subunit IID [Raoultella planticola]AUU04561.1 PTS fructose transporter subunit IID [Raoultella planticola]AUV55177.1 PTS fructose transporter subunit IID [Raoultella planticola]
MEERTLTRKDLRRCWRAWMMHNLSSMSFERLESFGFCLSMLPVAKKLYPDAAQRTEMLRRHASFYNTEPQIGAIVNGMALGLEEKKANGEPIDGETINTLKVGLMGPIAGIGDSMIPGMLIPILLSIGMALAAGGSILGPLFYTVAWLGIIIPGSWFLFLKGYKMGSGSVEMLVSSQSTRLREALSLLGVFVMGGVAASYVKLATGLEFVTKDGVNIHVQQMLDGIFPQLLPLVVVLGTWYLMAKRGVSPVKAMVLLLVLAALGVVSGLFAG